MKEGQMVNLITSLKNKKNQANQKRKMSAKPVYKEGLQVFLL